MDGHSLLWCVLPPSSKVLLVPVQCQELVRSAHFWWLLLGHLKSLLLHKSHLLKLHKSHLLKLHKSHSKHSRHK